VHIAERRGVAASHSCALSLMGRRFSFGTGAGGASFCVARPRPTWDGGAEPPIISACILRNFLDFLRSRTIVAVGGDYQDRRGGYKNAAISRGWRKTWNVRLNCPAGIDRRSGETTADMYCRPTGAGTRWTAYLEFDCRSDFNAYRFPGSQRGLERRPHGIMAKFLDPTEYLI